MKPSGIILTALLAVAVCFCWLSIMSLQQSRIRVVTVPADSHALATIQGILCNSNFQVVLHAIKQRSGDMELAGTIRGGEVNQLEAFTFTVTNR